MSHSLEDRVSQLEKELDQIKQSLGNSESKPDWIRETAGAFRNDAAFAEIVRLGKEERDAEQPETDE